MASAVSARLVYVKDAASASCPDEAGLRRGVTQRVGYDPFFAWAKTTVLVEITHESREFRAQVQLVDDSNHSLGVRELRSGANGCTWGWST